MMRLLIDHAGQAFLSCPSRPPQKKGGGIVGINQMGEYTSMGPRGSDLSLPDSVEAMRQLSINRKWILGLLLFGSLALLLLKLLGL